MLSEPEKHDERSEAPRAELLTPQPQKPETIPFLNYLFGELIMWYIMLAVLIILASLFPAGLEEKADPLRTPPHIKPEWYFLAIYQLLKLVPRSIGILTPIVGIIILLLLPFLDRNPEVHPRKRPLAIAIGLVVVVAMTILTIWGYYS
ncbi:MAG: cytochrome b subunit of the bc complex [Anaerolineae bacterium]